eukprot:gene2211-biopygen18490
MRAGDLMGWVEGAGGRASLPCAGMKMHIKSHGIRGWRVPQIRWGGAPWRLMCAGIWMGGGGGARGHPPVSCMYGVDAHCPPPPPTANRIMEALHAPRPSRQAAHSPGDGALSLFTGKVNDA